MAERRMFAKTIVLSDAFTEMPATARCLYFTLAMFADDDGFVNSPRGIMRQIGATDGDMHVLLSKKFVLLFDSGVIVIKHWRIHNYIQKDRYKPTKYQEEYEHLTTDEHGGYKLDTNCIQDVYKVDTQVRLGKESIGKDNNMADVEPIPLNDGSEWIPTNEQLEEWIRLYPSVDVVAEFRKMRGWCNAQPSRRKTARGIKTFVNGWLSRTQDKPHTAQTGGRKQIVPEYMTNPTGTAETEPQSNQEKASSEQIKDIEELLKKL